MDPQSPVKNAFGKTEPKVSLTLPNAQWTETLPKEYNLKFTNTAPSHEYVFTENSKGRALEIAGQIQHEASIGPVIDEDYRRIMQTRTEKATTKERFSSLLDEKESKSAGFKVGRDQTSTTFGIMVCPLGLCAHLLFTRKIHFFLKKNRGKKMSV
jgi:hypothetical protein